MKKLHLIVGGIGASAALAAGAVVAVVPAQAGAAPPPANCASGQNQAPRANTVSIVGLKSDNSLVCFRFNGVAGATTIGTLSGLTGDTGLVGIDFRVQNSLLYGVGDQGGIYTLSTTDAAATKVGQLSVPLSGTSFGVDFNPAANALRIVSNDGQNLRLPFNVGAAPGDPNPVTFVDTALNNGATPSAPVTGIVGAAYTNNDLLANTATTLFDLNAAANQIAIQSPANNGIVVATGTFTTDAVDGDLDIYTWPSNAKNKGYALVVTPTATRLGYVEPLTGQISAERNAPAGVVDLALPIAQ